MKSVLEEYIWSEKYRPQKIEDIVLPKGIKDKIKEGISDGKVTNFLFNGETGSGKTTTAFAIAKELDAEVLQINGSGSGIDSIRNDVANFCSTLSLNGNRKIVLIDEADGMSAEAFARLRGTIQEYSKNTSFIFTCNHKAKIPEPVRGRFVEIDFTIPDDQLNTLMGGMMKRMVEILKAEQYAGEIGTTEKQVIAGLVKKLYPNNRKILNELQLLASTNQIDPAALSIISTDKFSEIVEILKEKKWKRMREWVAENSDISPDDIIEWVWKNGEDVFGLPKMPMIIIHTDDYQRHASAARNVQIATVAFFTRVIQAIG